MAIDALIADPARQVRVERVPSLSGVRPIDVAEVFRDLPGLALLESARPGRGTRWSYLSAEPLVVLDRPADGSDVFAEARAVLGRMERRPLPEGPPFLGGLMGYLAYDLARRLERLPKLARDDQGLPEMRLGLHDWVVAFDRATGDVWLGGRAVEGAVEPLEGRLADVRERLAHLRSRAVAVRPSEQPPQLDFASGLDRSAFEAGVGSIRQRIADGEIYQANLTRRLETSFDEDPWPLYRRLRTGDPALLAAYLDIGPSADDRPRAIVSASPEPFLSVSADGRVSSDPIKGTRPRGRTRETDRALACELLASAKDRAENIMIVDVLRNDLGRVCRPGSVRVPRLCRLERTVAVQHLVSTVTGRLAHDRDVFDLLVSAFPGGSITGAPKIRAMRILETLEPVRRGPYTGALGWIGPDGQMRTSIIIRSFIADGRRLTLHVGGGITWRSDPAEEWHETVAKADGPLNAVAGREIAAQARGDGAGR